MASRRYLRNVLLLVLAFVLALTIGPTAATAEAEQSPLTPDPLVYENGNITLSKNAERISADEWKVTVKATIGEMPVEKRKIEVVFVLDCSGSMAWCTDEAVHAAEAGDHSHTNSCYSNTLICTKAVHEHSQNNGCYGSECTRNSNPAHWQQSRYGWSHIDGTTCEDLAWIGTKYYPLICTKEEHTHSKANRCYKMNCNKDKHPENGATPCTYVDENGREVEYKSRLQAAKETIASMVSNLTEDGDDTVTFKYVIFSGSGYDNGVNKSGATMVVSSFANVTAEGGTYMYTGIQTGINQFSNNENKKVLVVLTDGAANDKSDAAPGLADFKDPDKTDGTVFTVGFAYSNSTLANVAGNGGTYVHAGDSIELEEAMQGIEIALTAMLEDPMSSAVGFDKTSITTVQTSGGVVSSTDDTIYWHPAEDGSDTVRNSTIEYSYTVKLNQEANMSSGSHTVALNNPTYFRYGYKEGTNAPTQMKEAAFPIPHAEYSVSTMQTKWQADGRDIQPALEVEALVNNFASASYIPSFQQDYRTITPIIPIENSNDYYRYIGTTVTSDGTEIPGVDAVDATKPVAYVVVHQYERVNSHELTVGGTKTLVGRDFMPGDSFTFTLTPVTPGAPMPAKNTVPISPTSGTSVAFQFDTISYQEAGKEYTYTIQEQEGTQQGIIYDTAKHTLVVKTEEINKEIVVSYTMDGVENGLLTVRNQLETGSLKVEKNTVTSHLPEHQEKAFGFLVSAKDMSGRPINGDYEMLLKGGTTQTLTFTNGYAAVMLKAGESVVINGLPDGTTYTVTEDAAGGFTATAVGETGVIIANEQQTASFDNAYQSAGLYQFIATKRLEGGTLALDQFSFSVLDEAGNVVATGKNNPDGSVFLNTLHFTQDDIGTKTYTIVEDTGTEPAVLYDRTKYRVALTIADRGDGTLSVTDDLNGVPIVFTNKVIENQFVVSKTVDGNIGSKNKEFSFTIALPDMGGKTISVSRDNGDTFESVTLNENGEMSFTLRHDQSIIFYPVSGQYTITESDAGSYTTSYSINQGEAVVGRVATGEIDAGGGHVAFTNTLDISPPTGVHDSVSYALVGLMLAAVLISILRMGGGYARHE